MVKGRSISSVWPAPGAVVAVRPQRQRLAKPKVFLPQPVPLLGLALGLSLAAVLPDVEAPTRPPQPRFAPCSKRQLLRSNFTFLGARRKLSTTRREVVETDQVDLVARTMLRDLQQIDNTEEA